MNAGYTGGRTRFYPGGRNDSKVPDFQVQGETGSAVIFRQPPGQQYLHDGEQVTHGLKYLFRTDIMYIKSKQ